MHIDLRSDGVSKPSAEMLKAMMNARVGDDVFGDDPSVSDLEEYSAALFGKESALFCPSGVMANQVALLVLTPAYKKYLCNEFTHTYYFETGGPASMKGIDAVLCEHKNGILDVSSAEDILKNNADVKTAVIENTVNKGGGAIYKTNELKALSELFKRYQIKTHLDGARIFNALAETGDKPEEIGKLFDTVSFCLSKGLGAPAGSMLTGTAEIIAEARKVRNKLGGAMRQAGYLAAAGLYALKNNLHRIQEDHIHARIIAEALKKNKWIKEVMETCTNIVIAKTENDVIRDQLLNCFRAEKLYAVPFGEGAFRMVTHLNISREMALRAASIIESVKLV